MIGNNKIKYNFVTCYAVMSNFNRPLLLTELIEANLYFGVSKLVFYYQSSSKLVKNILQYYVRKGIADVYEYKHDKYLKEIERSSRNKGYLYHLIYYKMNHCFFSYRTISKYMLFLDLDEILWPAEAKNYYQLLSLIPKREMYYVHSYFFQTEYVIPNYLDKNMSVVLPDIDLFSIKKYCPNHDGLVRKYIMLNPKIFDAAEIHDSFARIKIKRTYISGNIAFIRHSRNFNNKIKKRCPESLLQYKENNEEDKLIYAKSMRIVNFLNSTI